MSEFIKKFRPPTLKRYDIEHGVGYVETPTQTDWLGQELNVGDIVVYSRGSGSSSSELILAKIIGMYTKIVPNRISPEREPKLYTTVSVVLKSGWVDKKFRRLGVDVKKLIKITPEQYTDKVSKDLLEA